MLPTGNDVQIAITGLANSGKSALMTSLLWQLAEFGDADFFLPGAAKIEGFRELRTPGDAGASFPFDRYRDALTRSSRWPDKTRDCYEYACEYARSDWRRFSLRRLSRLQWTSRQRAEFLDFPGERIADAAIAAFDDYAEWSDHLLEHMRSHGDYSDAARPYLDLLEHPEPGEEAVLVEYKRTLATLILGYKPLISPSVFLLDCAGAPASGRDVAELAASRLVGLTPESEFAPLSAGAREAAPALAETMARRYLSYRKALALPLFERIGRSNRLVVLVDIPSLLMGGVGRYNDNRQVLLDLFESLRPDSSIGGRLWRLLTFWQGRVERVALVATKADLVHPADVENGRLESLLRQMTARAKSMLEDVAFEWFVCSAARSTRAGSGERTLIGRLASEPPEAKEVEFRVSALPETWPGDWSPGEFRFSRVHPEVSRNLQIPPAHVGLDRLFAFLTS